MLANIGWLRDLKPGGIKGTSFGVGLGRLGGEGGCFDDVVVVVVVVVFDVFDGGSNVSDFERLDVVVDGGEEASSWFLESESESESESCNARFFLGIEGDTSLMTQRNA